MDNPGSHGDASTAGGGGLAWSIFLEGFDGIEVYSRPQRMAFKYNQLLRIEAQLGIAVKNHSVGFGKTEWMAFKYVVKIIFVTYYSESNERSMFVMVL
jgi:hypothetical protein